LNNNTQNDEDQPNTKLNHAKDPLKMLSEPITRVREKKLIALFKTYGVKCT
jgi:hypothetical protein